MNNESDMILVLGLRDQIAFASLKNYVLGTRSYFVGTRLLCCGNEILCRGNEINMSWEQNLVGMR